MCTYINTNQYSHHLRLHDCLQVDMISFLPHYLEGLFGILASENRDFRLKVPPPAAVGPGSYLELPATSATWESQAQECLESLLEHIRRSAADRPERTQKAIAEALGTLGPGFFVGAREALRKHCLAGHSLGRYRED